MAGSATLSKPSASSVGTTYATASHSADGWPYPDDAGTTTTTSGNTTTTTTISYKNGVFKWTFSDNSTSTTKNGSHTFTGLSAGASNTLRASLSVSVTKVKTVTKVTTKTEKVDTGKKDENGNAIYEDKTTTTTEGPTTTESTVSLGSASDSTTVYTKPYSFSFDFESGTIIEDNLTAKKWNDGLIALIGKYNSWSSLSNKYSSYNHLKVSKGDWIDADVYNNTAAACGISTRVTKDVTLITADIINALADGVS